MRLSATMPWLVALVLVLGLGGCNRPRFGTPQDAYTSFHRLVKRGELQQAWGALSKPTQDALAQRAQVVGAASGGEEKPEPLALFFANVPPPPDVTEVSLVREEGDVATVLVRAGGNSHEVRMVREPSGWKVDLSASLQP
ncbi:hypothetical protein HUW63_17135 [Myxococcus sp. AM001]|uniref:hypothetical protein n=1 Tax=Myxococcus TaxID=32 RepID=UPI0013D7AAC4|nr:MULTISPECIES: hypothetical protein [Myxococcus]NVJ06963.1 hypothetical protein [Myxococcus sp. AM001]NVJ17815.1 hypothetical protein [Myxococcus sp. AM010]